MPRPGVYEALITLGLQAELDALREAGQAMQTQAQNLDWFDDALGMHVFALVKRALKDMGAKDLEARVELVRDLLKTVNAASPDVVSLPRDEPVASRQALTWVGPKTAALVSPKPPARPEHGLVHPALLFGGGQDVSLNHELVAEMASADSIDAVVAFLKFSGLSLLRASLIRFMERGGRLRLITTTYTGATEARAVRELVELGARVRVSYEDASTRLHAKAWLFQRNSGMCTAYVGSSNLSRAAMTDGVEWNVRMTRHRTPAVVETFEQAFEQLWEEMRADHVVADDTERLATALRQTRTSDADSALQRVLAGVDVAAKPHQVEVLDALTSERQRGYCHNLVVSATGTGKTWMSAFDFDRLRCAGDVSTLLFVAHRREILEQARAVFRLVTKDPGFGEMWVGGERPVTGTHVFASIQSLGVDVLAAIATDAYDMVIIDEFHHAAAPTYRKVMAHFTPAILLGLTATPERMDGVDIGHWFEHRTAAEIRLWDALKEGLLAPFHYYGIHDPTSAERAWKRGRLDVAELDSLYSGDDVRARYVVGAVSRYVADPTSMRALGFCVGVGHAQRMALTFNQAGIAARAIHGGTPPAERSAAIRELREGLVQALFTVDLFNEGVDLPEVDTVLFLRPTQSATVFLQQLGRGLRRHRDKAQLLVLDFVGHVHEKYRYDVRYRALIGGTLREMQATIERDFPRLPAGCAITLEPMARETVLQSVRRFVGRGGLAMRVAELRALPSETTLGTYLERTGLDLQDVYAGAGRSWTQLRRKAGHVPSSTEDTRLLRTMGRLLHVDDPERLGAWKRWLSQSSPPKLASLSVKERALLAMLVVSVGDARRPVAEMDDELARIWSYAEVRRELTELLDVLDQRSRRRTYGLLPDLTGPLSIHATYSRREVIAALGVTSKGRFREHREGPLYVPERALDAMFVTLDKSDDVFKPSIRYADYPISPTRLHWESQNRIHEDTPTGRRYVERGSSVVFFVRERPSDSRGEAMPFRFLGKASYLTHQSARPMQIEWHLDTPMPTSLWTAGQRVAR